MRNVPMRTGNRVVRVDLAQDAPVAMGALRTVLGALEAEAPQQVRALAQTHPSAWNRLFPNTFPGAPALFDVALSPSERRLHRESEQVFQVLNLAAEVIAETVSTLNLDLRLDRCGAADMVSLRGIMRAAEWLRLSAGPRLKLDGWVFEPAVGAGRFASRRARFHAALRERMRLVEADGATPLTAVEQGSGLLDIREPEAPFLRILLDSSEALERRLAAAVRTLRACFFSTNYEGAMLAVERGLALLEEYGPSVRSSAVFDAWDEFEPDASTAAVEIERDDLGGVAELRALFHRAEGVVWSFCGENDASLQSFGRGIESKPGPVCQAHLHMFRALNLIKRMGQLGQAREEGLEGLRLLGDVATPRQRVHAAWLHNVIALTWFQEKKLEPAASEVLKAIECVRDQHSASAIHLRINLITNLSSLQEASGRYPASIATWRQFERVKAAWDDNFSKHHRYRLAALYRRAGSMSEALGHYQEAYRSATSANDPFHQQVIASDLGYCYLMDGAPEQSIEWFDRAVQHALAVGDPFHVGEGIVGLWLSRGGDASAAEASFLADGTWPNRSKRLLTALKASQTAELKEALTAPRTKLNRPFDLANLY